MISQENTDVSSGYVQVVWNKVRAENCRSSASVGLCSKSILVPRLLKDSTVFDFDIPAYRRMMYFQRSCWPLRFVATHVCCSPRSSLKIVKPIVFAFMFKGSRSRSIIHDASESEIIDVLAGYGILSYMLPTEMGGTLRQSQSEWIKVRRSIEMEEIA